MTAMILVTLAMILVTLAVTRSPSTTWQFAISPLIASGCLHRKAAWSWRLLTSKVFTTLLSLRLCLSSQRTLKGPPSQSHCRNEINDSHSPVFWEASLCMTKLTHIFPFPEKCRSMWKPWSLPCCCLWCQFVWLTSSLPGASLWLALGLETGRQG